MLGETLYDDLDLGVGREGATPPDVASRPTAGRFYTIRFGEGGLLRTTARAYGVPIQPNPIELARLINDNPYNRRFWRTSKSAWERAHFPEGIISFNPRFTCDVRAQQATPPGRRAPSGSCFATIWIPPATRLVHPILGRGTSLPLRALGLFPRAVAQAAPAPSDPFGVRTQALDLLRRMCESDERQLPIAPPDTRRSAPSTERAPYQWICMITSIFRDRNDPTGTSNFLFAHGAGVLIGRHHILTAAHVVCSLFRLEDQSTGMLVGYSAQKALGVLVVPGRHGTAEMPGGANTSDRPFGELFIDFSADLTRLRIPRAFIRSLRPGRTSMPGRTSVDFDVGADFALIRYAPRDRVDPSIALPSGFWGGSAGRLSPTQTVIGEPARRLVPDTGVVTAGYPRNENCQQLEGSGRIRTLTIDQFDHDADIGIGHSGGPVWTVTPVISRARIVRRTLHLVGIQSRWKDLGTGEIRGEAVRLRAAWPTISGWLAEDNLRLLR